MYRCETCRRTWDDELAAGNDFRCSKRCGGALLPVEPLELPNLDGLDFNVLPYPVALTARRLSDALETSSDVLKTLFTLKDCIEATVKYLGIVLLADYFSSSASTPERNETLLEKMVRPSLGVWVTHVVGDTSRWLCSAEGDCESRAAHIFVTPAAGRGRKPQATELLKQCEAFVTYRNDALGHGARRPDHIYKDDLAGWLPLTRRLLDAVHAPPNGRFG